MDKNNSFFMLYDSQKAKPTSKRPVEHLILETRRKDELREQAIAETKYQKQCDLKVRNIYYSLEISGVGLC